MACRLTDAGYLDMAVLVLMALCTYLRPGQMLGLRRGSLAPPAAGATSTWSLLVHPMESGTTSKTGDRDISILLDSAWLSWMPPVYEELIKGDPELPLFEFNYAQFLMQFRKAVRALGLPSVVPYQLRHSGASADRGEDSRSLLEVQRRGQWRSVRSVQRYEKAARLATSAHRLRPEMREHTAQCEQALEGVVLYGRSTPPVPSAGGAGTAS